MVEQLKKWVKEEETEPGYKLNSLNYLDYRKPLVVLYSMNCGNDEREYLMGTYTTHAAAQNKCVWLTKSTSSSYYMCEELFHLNKIAIKISVIYFLLCSY